MKIASKGRKNALLKAYIRLYDEDDLCSGQPKREHLVNTRKYKVNACIPERKNAFKMYGYKDVPRLS